MTMEDIFKTMQDLIAEQFAIDADEISMDSSFVDDLGADSVDLVELVMAMEEEFNVGEIDEDDLTGLKTVGDCVRYLNNKMSCHDREERTPRWSLSTGLSFPAGKELCNAYFRGASGLYLPGSEAAGGRFISQLLRQ